MVSRIAVLLVAVAGGSMAAPRFELSFPAAKSAQALDGRMLLLVSDDGSAEPRFQISDTPKSQIVFGVDVEGLKPGDNAVLDAKAFGYPVRSLAELPAGDYFVQGLLHRYETVHLADGRVLKLPMDRGEGQQWSRAPGNLYSTPRKMHIDAKARVNLVLDQEIPPIEPLKDSKYIKHIRIQSERLTKFWGRPMYLGAHILLPEGFDDHPQARYPVCVFHGHFPADFGGFRPEPPDPDLKPDYSDRFHVSGYNRIEQEEAHKFYKTWTGPGFPRMLIVEIQHANPYYDDSYAVNSANLGPYGDAITYELIPYIEKQFRGIGQGWARFLYGGSTGGWEALAAQVFYPDEYNGTFAACPDPIDFRAYTTIDIYKDKNAYYLEGAHKRVPRPAMRNYLGHVSSMQTDANAFELALGTHSRSGQQFDIWEAVYSPAGADGYPKRIFNKETGEIDHSTAEYWLKNYDLRNIMQRDWPALGPKLQGKIHIFCGDMDTYYLNNAVYLMEDFLKSTKNPPAQAEVAYGDRAEHCWNGDPAQPNYITRLRYNTMYVARILERIKASAPAGADVTSWRY
ncbi:MAG: alpha/beta hydrolase-fold protein [Acidobacteria bacterium]|nr:alpha/beta hydrolase-fold protein [Acidobacteriota bacterium]